MKRGIGLVVGLAALWTCGLACSKGKSAADPTAGADGKDARACRVTLENGATIELLAMWRGAKAALRTWWRPDGTPIDEGTYARFNEKLDADCAWGTARSGYVFRHTPTPRGGPAVRSSTTIGKLLSLFSGEEDGLCLALLPVESDQAGPESVDIEVSAALGAWEAFPVEVRDGQFSGTAVVAGGATVSLTGPREVDAQAGTFVVDVTADTPELNVNVLFARANGQEQTLYGFLTEVLPAAGPGAPPRVRHSFRVGGGPASVRCLSILARRYQGVTFQNVSLQPGRRTRPRTVLPQGATRPAREARP